MAEDIVMPPPERAAKTALGTSTVTSYLKADDILKSDVPKGKTLDFGAGRGLGAKAIGADTYEPYVQSNPKYNQVNQIKSNSYDKITSLNVLNTIEPEARKEAVKNIGRVLKPNGVAVISTRGKDVEEAKIKTKAKDGYIIGKGEQARFQKGFTQDELKNYVQKTLGDNYKVESVKGLGKAAIKVKKLNVDPTPVYKTLSIKGANFPGGKLTKRFNEGGTTMKKQMELFEEGGLKDEGGMVDEVSGNDVPPGSTREEVRDDIPAQLSEGEFVFPADVVRYIGLEKLMMMRQEAKQGLKAMEAMGQMGNSDEATMPDDLPFDETDLDIEDDLEYNTGGVVQAQRGTYVAPTVPTGSQPLGTTPMGAPPIPQQVGTGVSGTAFGTPYTPNVGKMYRAGATPYAPVTYTELLGPSAAGAPQTKNVRYVNEATNQTRMIPHLLNADGTIGDTLYPVPQGFVRKDEAPKEEAKKTQVQTAKVAPVESGDGAPSGTTTSAVDPAGDPLSYSSMFDMDNLDKQMSKIGAMQLSTLGKAGIAQGVFGAVTGTPERNQMKLGAITPTFTSLKEKLGLKGKNLVNATKQQRNVIAANVERVSAAIDRLTTNITFSKDEKGNTISTESNKSTADVIAEVNAMADKYGLDKIDTKNNVNLGSKIGQKVAEINAAIQEQPTYSEDPSDTIESLDPTAGDVYSDETQTTTAAEQAANIAAAQSFMDSNDNNDGGFGDVSDDAGPSDDDSAGLGGEDVAKGSLITKRKASGKVKKKYMKRGGLASR